MTVYHGCYKDACPESLGYNRHDEVNGKRGAAFQWSVGSAVDVKRNVLTDRLSGLRDALVGLQVELLVVDALPKSFN